MREREGGREGGREREREGGREGGREEGERERERERERDYNKIPHSPNSLFIFFFDFLHFMDNGSILGLFIDHTHDYKNHHDNHQ